MTAIEAHISEVAVTMGDSLTIDYAIGNRVSAEALKFLKEDGFERVLVSPNSVLDMARDCVSQLLSRRPEARSAIDAVIFCSESLTDSSPDPASQADVVADVGSFRRNLQKLILSDLGLRDAQLFALWTAECSNFSNALAVAQSLVGGGRAKSVLIVLSDRAGPHSRRLLGSGNAVLSDACACCLVETRGLYRIKDVAVKMATNLLEARLLTPGAPTTREFIASARSLRDAVDRHLGQVRDDRISFYGDNLHSSIYECLGFAVGVDPEEIKVPTKPMFGHAHSADGLLTLWHLRRETPRPSGDIVMLFNLGPVLLSAIVLEVV